MVRWFSVGVFVCLMFVPHSASWFNICFVLIAHFRELLLNRMNFEDDHDPRLLWASWRSRRFQWASSSRVCAICQLQNAIFNSHKFFFRVAQARWRQNWLENMWRKKKVTFTWNAPTHTAMHGTMLAFHVAPHRCVCMGEVNGCDVMSCRGKIEISIEF